MAPFAIAGFLCGWCTCVLARLAARNDLHRGFITKHWLPLPCALITCISAILVCRRESAAADCITSLLSVCFAIFHSLTDTENGYIYDQAVIVSLAAAALVTILQDGLCGLRGLVLGACFGALPLEAVSLVFRGAVGTGDVFLMCGLGALVGWKNALFILYFSLIAGGFCAAMLLLTGRARKKTELPFAPFALFGTFCVTVLDLTPQKFILWFVNLIN